MEGLRIKEVRETKKNFNPRFSIEEKPSIEYMIKNWTPEQLAEYARENQRRKERREENLRGLRQALTDLENLLNK